jgi:hypothetical protein
LLAFFTTVVTLLPVSPAINVNLWKAVTTIVVVTGGKLAAGVVDTSCAI